MALPLGKLTILVGAGESNGLLRCGNSLRKCFLDEEARVLLVLYLFRFDFLVCD